MPMEAGEPLVTVELWRRLRAFDRRCFISVERRTPSHISPFSRYPRVWRAQIAPQDARAYERVGAEHPQFVEALRLVIELGEERGWHLCIR
jgi:hypothetical protein